MQDAIAEVVSRAFYSSSGGLKTMRSDEIHPLSSPDWIDGRSLIWLDTEEAQRAEGFEEEPSGLLHPPILCTRATHLSRPRRCGSRMPNKARGHVQ